MKAQERQLNLVAYLYHHRFGRTLLEILQDIPAYGQGDAARKKFQRDRKQLEQHGIPVNVRLLAGEEESGNLAYRYNISRRDVFSRRINFNQDEIQALSWLSRQLKDDEEFPLKNFARSAWEKFQAGNNQLKEKELPARILNYKVNRGRQPLFESVSEALFDRRKIRIIYGSFSSGEEQERIIRPHGLLSRYSAWSLVAWCELRNAFREFRISRIKKLVLLDEPFTLDPGFNLGDWQSSERWQMGLGNGTNVELLFDQEVRKVIRRSLSDLAEFEERENGLLVKFQINDTERFLRWLLTWGRHVRIVNPPLIRRKFIALLNNALALYGEPSDG
jgi:predicted DNA-binding transcriptional regulator YafY